MKKWEEIPSIDLFSDGAAEPNPGKGGYGIILSWEGIQREISQGFKMTTNNRMELLGVIVGLENLKTKAHVNVYTDSRYVIDGIEKGWAKKWKENNWYRNKKEKAINIDLWERLLDSISKNEEVIFHWIKGHNGHTENERCDWLATQAILSENLLDDEGFEIQKNSDTSGKITKEGDLCRHCNVPVIKVIPIKRKLKPNQSYYFEYYMQCPQCGIPYMVEEAKRAIDKIDAPQLF